MRRIPLLRLHHARSIAHRYRPVLHVDYRRSLSLLQHRHLRGDNGAAFVDYNVAQEIQDQHRSQFLSWKASLDDHAKLNSNQSPRPLLISFESSPTYTIGRRQEDFEPSQVARLQQRLDVDLTHRAANPIVRSFRPEVVKTSRGGLTTYHGPGQVVFWPVIDMHSPLHANFGVASYASHLEATTQRLLQEMFGIRTSTVPDEPGVWIDASGNRPRKIAAMGVHHRRYVTALGLALNVDVPVTGGEDVNPWSRFVPCGLHGKDVTSVAAELGPAGPETWDIVRIAERWAAMFEEGLLKTE